MKPVTPLETNNVLAEKLNIPKLLLKREDLHPLGSHKGRSIPLMIDYGLSKGAKAFAISSSGNAALASIRYIKKLNKEREFQNNIKLSIFIGRKIESDKLKSLKDEALNDINISLDESERPLQSLHKAERNGSWSLRQSTDQNAPSGYSALAEELSTISDLESIFIGTSSGTTALGLLNAFSKTRKIVKINIVQTEACHTIAEEFDKDFKEKNDSLAHAIVDKVGHRKNEILEKLEDTGGTGWVVNDEIITKAKNLAKESGLDLSNNAVLGIAGLIKAQKKGYKPSGSVVCIVSGK